MYKPTTQELQELGFTQNGEYFEKGVVTYTPNKCWHVRGRNFKINSPEQLGKLLSSL